MSDISAKLRDYKAYFDEELRAFLDRLERNGAEQPLLEAVRYSIENGGKRIRPFLVFLGAEFIGHAKEEVINYALAIEFVHSYSLVHDDLPCMDDDTLRRGVPTTHVKYGEGMAVLTGDAMLNMAYEIALSKANIASNDVRALRHFASVAGIFGMVGGQCIDIRDNEKVGMTFDELINLYYLKTSKLISGALLTGALASGASDDEIEALELYARNVGIIFQIVDDILDVTSTEAELGKNIGSDSDNGKATSIRYMSIDEARAYICTLESEISARLRVYGERADDLLALSSMLSRRNK